MTSTHLPFGHPAWIEIDLKQFKKNIKAIQNHVGHAKICLAIKANAYGHGLIPIAREAVKAGVHCLAVASLQEGALLREAGIKIPVLVFGAIHDEQISGLLNYDLEFSISSRLKAELVKKKCEALQKKCRVHLEIDTGMQRTGVRLSSALDLLNDLVQMKCFDIAGVYSHLATADNPDNEFAHHQIKSFQKFIREEVKSKDKNIICHIANSSGISYYPESHMDMVRPGILAYGYFPTQHNEKLKDIAPIFSVKAKIVYFKVVSKGQGIGYSHTYKTQEDSRILTIPVGYGDGYRRGLSNKGEVLIRGKRYPIVGNICMDQLMVNIGQDEAYVGEEVTLIGKQEHEEIKLTEVAKLCDTITYEILCGFNNRLPRMYIDDGQVFFEDKRH
ncbi:MAG: alanine racemase [Proteobacteria bacterium]|nr:alanine racemase [Pseudomonadota bacterium]